MVELALVVAQDILTMVCQCIPSTFDSQFCFPILQHVVL